MKTLTKDPLNLIIAGVGGQGNVMISLLIGKAFVRQGYFVTIGETYGASQRSGSVMSHLRISRESQYSPFIPNGRADIILGMEPVETLRILQQFGNSDVITITNSRLVYAVGMEYPSLDKVAEAIKGLSARLWLIDATDEAAKLGDPVFANMILIGTLIGSGILPLDKESLERILRESVPKEKLDANMLAFNKGMELVNRG
ncbi:MAG: indolepyruvate ferredoxin oxidoreductase [Chloroflexi bacterium CG15_BIG_FIL_POST_REV_8_21_14_020_46_15]|nr:MAG: indolepyruvate ferredoxin oxidoreductase [Chloroflexi bacterium CG15_BIG_FIL_POST_REV_8_21_14_020_46_15]